VIGWGVSILWGVENCPFPLTKPVAVNTGLALPRSLWWNEPSRLTNRRASPHFGRYSFRIPVPPRVGGWVGLGGWWHDTAQRRSPIPVDLSTTTYRHFCIVAANNFITKTTTWKCTTFVEVSYFFTAVSLARRTLITFTKRHTYVSLFSGSYK